MVALFDGLVHDRGGRGEERLSAFCPAITVVAGPAVKDLVAWFSHWADRETMRALEARDLSTLKVRERIATGVQTRLSVLAPHREAVRRALALLTAPQNLALGARLLYEAVDAIWYAAGDTATDFNFYTKRALLAGVYGATTLYWLDDRSPDTRTHPAGGPHRPPAGFPATIPAGPHPFPSRTRPLSPPGP